MKNYRVNEIFFSLQGEGVRAGTANIFLRFTGCNLRCDVQAGELSPGGFACDTEFMSGRNMTAEEILAFCNKIAPDCRSVIFTGGEPTLQLDQELINAFRGIGFYLAIETNGSRPVPEGLDWITVSPKIAEHCIKQLKANEVKYVRAMGQAIPKTVVQAENHLISPAFDNGKLSKENLEWAIQLVKENPTWRLSMQLHKLAWGVR